MTQFKVQFFAGIREGAGVSEATVQLADGTTVIELKRAIIQRYPAIESLLARSRVAVNMSFVDDDYCLQPGDEIAVIPPVSGG